MANAPLLLVSLLVCHYMADFCLTSPAVIKAKADGRNLLPILLNASIHGVLMGICLLFWSVPLKWFHLAPISSHHPLPSFTSFAGDVPSGATLFSPTACLRTSVTRMI